MQPPNLWDGNVGGRDSPSLWPRIRAAAGDLQGVREPALCLPNAPVSCESPRPQLREPIYTLPPPGHPRESLSRDLLFLLRTGHGCHSAGRSILWLRWSHACTRSQALWVQSHWVAVAVVWPACLRPAGGRSGAASVLNLNSFLPSSASSSIPGAQLPDLLILESTQGRSDAASARRVSVKVTSLGPGPCLGGREGEPRQAEPLLPL